jgi:hypothetical protein
MFEYERKYVTLVSLFEASGDGHGYGKEANVEIRRMFGEKYAVVTNMYLWVVESNLVLDDCGTYTDDDDDDYEDEVMVGWGKNACAFAEDGILYLFRVEKCVTGIKCIGPPAIGGIVNGRHTIILHKSCDGHDRDGVPENVNIISRLPARHHITNLPTELDHIVYSYLGGSVGLHDTTADIDNFEYVAQLDVATNRDIRGKKWHHCSDVWVSGEACVTISHTRERETRVDEITSHGDTHEHVQHIIIDVSKLADGGSLTQLDHIMHLERDNHSVDICDGCILVDNKLYAYFRSGRLGKPYDITPSYTIIPYQHGDTHGDIDIIW